MTTRPASIIVCTYNRAALLPKIIRELRIQEYPSDAFEIIIVDNGSTDHTQEVVRRFMTDSGVPVQYVIEHGNGVTCARNRGALVANHPYLVYLDDDCSVQSNWLAQLVQGFDLDDDVVVVGGRIVLDWSKTDRPTWLGSGLERWLAETSHLGDRNRILEENEQIMEGNMALKWEAWQSVGGFLGMEQFGSRNMAAGEAHLMLHQLRQRGGKIAFIPQAVAAHLMSNITRSRFLERGFWQGVSDGILDDLLYRRSCISKASHLILDAAAAIILIGYTFFSILKPDQALFMQNLIRAVRRMGLIFSQMHIFGIWRKVALWESEHPHVK